ASSCSVVIKSRDGKRASSERGPVGAALQRPDSVPLPSAQNRPQRSVSIPEERQLPDVIEGKPLTDIEDGVTTVQTRERYVSAYAIARRKAVCRTSTVAPSRSGINRVAPSIVPANL